MNLKDEFETPQWLFDILNEEFHFDHDVCAEFANRKCYTYWSKNTDALSIDWSKTPDTKVFWMNPPYSRPEPWVKKAYEESMKGATVVALLPVDTSTSWWHTWVTKACEIRFIKGRLKFSGQGPARFASAIVIFKPNREYWQNNPFATGPFVMWWDPRKEIAEKFIERVKEA